MGRRGYPLELRRKALNLVEAERAIAEVAKALGSAPSRSHLAPPGPHRQGRTVRPEQPRAQPANLGEPWPDLQQPSGGYRMQAMPYQWAKAGPAVASMTSTTSCMTRHSSWWRLAGCWATERRHRRVDGVVPSYGYRPRRRAQDVIAELRFLDTPTRNYQALILVGPWTTQAPRMPQPPTLTAICSMSRFFREATAPI